MVIVLFTYCSFGLYFSTSPDLYCISIFVRYEICHHFSHCTVCHKRAMISVSIMYKRDQFTVDDRMSFFCIHTNSLCWLTRFLLNTFIHTVWPIVGVSAWHNDNCSIAVLWFYMQCENTLLTVCARYKCMYWIEKYVHKIVFKLWSFDLGSMSVCALCLMYLWSLFVSFLASHKQMEVCQNRPSLCLFPT